MGRRLKAGWEAHLSGKVDLWVSVLVLSRLLPTLAWNFFFVATTRGMSETGCIRDELGPCLASPLGCLDRGNSSEGGRSWPGDSADGWVSSQPQACSPLPAWDSTDENWISSGHIRGGTPVFMFMYLDSRQL